MFHLNGQFKTEHTIVQDLKHIKHSWSTFYASFELYPQTRTNQSFGLICASCLRTRALIDESIHADYCIKNTLEISYPGKITFKFLNSNDHPQHESVRVCNVTCTGTVHFPTIMHLYRLRSAVAAIYWLQWIVNSRLFYSRMTNDTSGSWSESWFWIQEAETCERTESVRVLLLKVTHPFHDVLPAPVVTLSKSRTCLSLKNSQILFE